MEMSTKISTVNSFPATHFIFILFYSNQLGDLSNVLVGVDNMDRELTKPDSGHLL